MLRVKNYHFFREKKFYFDYICDPAFHDITKTLVSKIEHLLLEPKKIIKNTPNDTTTVAVIELDSKLYVIKRYNFKSLFHRLKLQLRKSHGFKSFHFAKILNKLGVPSIKPVAVIQTKFGFWKGVSYFVSEYEEGISASAYFSDSNPDKSSWPVAILFIKLMTDNLRSNLIYHGDYQFGNILIKNNRPILVDFDRIKVILSRKRYLKLFQKDLVNFTRHFKSNPIAFSEFAKIFNFPVNQPLELADEIEHTVMTFADPLQLEA